MGRKRRAGSDMSEFELGKADKRILFTQCLRDPLVKSPHPPKRTGVNTTEGKTRPQTHGVDSIHLWRHFSSKSLPSTIQRPQARIDYQNMIIDPSNESYVNGEKFQSESPQTQPEQDL